MSDAADAGPDSSRDPGEAADCPFCGSTDVRLEGRKGTSICRRLFFCPSCEQPFEEFG